MILIPSVATAGLIVNGGFESGNFDGWTVSGTMQYYGVAHGSAVHSGLWGAWFGEEVGMTYISQMIPTTSGESYSVTFFVANWLQAGSQPENRGEFWWDGTLIDSGTNVPTIGWQQNSYILTATQSSTEVKLGFYNPPGWWMVDDIDASAVPEPATAILLLTGLGGTMLLGRRHGMHLHDKLRPEA